MRQDFVEDLRKVLELIFMTSSSPIASPFLHDVKTHGKLEKNLITGIRFDLRKTGKGAQQYCHAVSGIAFYTGEDYRNCVCKRGTRVTFFFFFGKEVWKNGSSYSSFYSDTWLSGIILTLNPNSPPAAQGGTSSLLSSPLLFSPRPVLSPGRGWRGWRAPRLAAPC